MRAAYKDIVLGATLIALCLLTLFWLIPVGIDSPGSISNRALAPAFWPHLIMIAMTGLSAIVLIQGISAYRTARARDFGDKDKAISNPTGKAKVAIAAVMLFVFTWSMTWAGIVVPSMVALAFFIALHGERRIKLILPVAVGVPIGLYLFFLKVALVPMPLGIFEELLW